MPSAILRLVEPGPFAPGDTITFELVTSADFPAFVGFDANLEYDADELDLLDIVVQPVEFIFPITVPDDTGASGDQSFFVTSGGLSPISGEVQVATLTFSAKAGTDDANVSLTPFGGGIFTGSDFSALITEPVTATVVIEEEFVNTPPVANADIFMLDEDDPATILNVLGNDTDVDGHALDVTAVTEADHGTVTLVNGVVSYQPDANFNGPDSFSYTIDDGFGGTATTTVTIDVVSVNDAPVPGEVFGVFTEDEVPSLDLLSGATDADEDSLSIATGSVLVSAEDGREVAFSLDGSTLTLDQGQFEDLDNFDELALSVTYGVTDGSTTTLAGADFTILGANDAPEITSTSFSIVENTTDVGMVAATDPEDDQLEFSISGGADAGLFEIDPDGTLRFVDAPDFEAPGSENDDNTYEVEVTVTDGNGPPAGAGGAGSSGSDTKVLLVSVFDDPTDTGAGTGTVTGSDAVDILKGFAGDEVFEPGAGSLDLIDLRAGGADTIVFGEEASNGVREFDYVLGFGSDDKLDLGDVTIASELNFFGRTLLYLDGDDDVIVLFGISDFDDSQMLV